MQNSAKTDSIGPSTTVKKIDLDFTITRKFRSTVTETKNSVLKTVSTAGKNRNVYQQISPTFYFLRNLSKTFSASSNSSGLPIGYHSPAFIIFMGYSFAIVANV